LAILLALILASDLALTREESGRNPGELYRFASDTDYRY
jgi:hypothetical protein